MRRTQTATFSLFFAALAVLAGNGTAQTEWRPLRQLHGIKSHAMAYDIARDTTVAFSPLGQTWERRSGTWTRRFSVTTPDGSPFLAMAYDASRHRTVLFGAGTPRAETWEWDGHTWVQRTPMNPPPARTDHAMVYDPARGRVVLFGGRDGASLLADTWEWDGTTWTVRTPANQPLARYAHAMAYDPGRQRVVLFGGENAARHPFADTWEWDGSDWTRRSVSASPPARSRHAMATAPSARGVVLFGGENYVSSQIMGDTWRWNGSNWSAANPPASPSSRRNLGMVLDRAANRVVLLGGLRAAWPYVGDDTWEWDGASWHGPSAPVTPRGGALVYDAARQRVVHVDANQTWLWDGIAWAEAPASVNHPTGLLPTMAYDAARQRVVLFGGDGAPTFVQHWEWDGANWTRRLPSRMPPPRYAHQMAYDAGRQRIVLFGGIGQRGFLSDTWEWDGATWAQRFPSTRPGPRAAHAMAYDAARQRTVLFGGSVRGGQSSETWEWDGGSWSLRQPSSRPSVRNSHSMVYDAVRQRVVLFGGNDYVTNQNFADTWEWDGIDWVRQQTPSAPPEMVGYQGFLAYDAARDRVVAHDGSKTWLYGTLTPAATTSFGTGRGGARGAPTIAGFGVPDLGTTIFALDLIGAAPGAACAFGVAFATQNAPLGSCTLYLQGPVVTLPTSTSASGFASFSLPIPRNPSVYGLTLYAQGFVADPAGPFAGVLSFSQGLRLTLGE